DEAFSQRSTLAPAPDTEEELALFREGLTVPVISQHVLHSGLELLDPFPEKTARGEARGVEVSQDALDRPLAMDRDTHLLHLVEGRLLQELVVGAVVVLVDALSSTAFLAEEVFDDGADRILPGATDCPKTAVSEDGDGAAGVHLVVELAQNLRLVEPVEGSADRDQVGTPP